MATYSERIRELRVLHGMSQQDLADRLDVNKVTISQYERGVRKPDLNALTALCDIFNVSSDYLIGKDDTTIRIVGKEGLERLVSARTKRIPVLGRVAAGIPIDAIEDVLEDWEEIPEAMAAGVEPAPHADKQLCWRVLLQYVFQIDTKKEAEPTPRPYEKCVHAVTFFS